MGEYFDKKKSEKKPDRVFNRLELKVIAGAARKRYLKQKEVPVVAEVVQQKVPVAKVAQQKVPSDIMVSLTWGNEKTIRLFPRSFPENGLSNLVCRAFPDLQGKDFYLSYTVLGKHCWDMKTKRVDDEHDWESAVQYYKKVHGFSGLFFDVIMKQKTVPAVARKRNRKSRKRWGSSDSEDEDSGSS